jgi:2-oxoacid:acceptor oxidoreductase gamma subunit (pyruvate/2-ketoisovalerate family)
MTEIVIVGRGGQGGVTLAKLIAMLYFLEGRYVQAFGVYAAERAGAPVRAYVRIDDQEITCRNQIYQPDHVIVLDPALIDERITTGLKAGGWIILNSPSPPEHFREKLAGYRIAAVDATNLAVLNSLGTRTTPIVNTTILGATARVLEKSFDTVEAALDDFQFPAANLVSAREAYGSVRMAEAGDAPPVVVAPLPAPPINSILDMSANYLPVIKTGTWAKQKPLRQELNSPCNAACPAGNDVRGFVQAIGQDDLSAALSILLETSPFPSICGRVCPAPCMDSCHRYLLDGAVNVRELERYVGDFIDRPERLPTLNLQEVAVIGSGPAGLSATYQLARLGYRVTIFEGGDELGGLLRTGIPAYRLPRPVLDREIDYILRHGVKADTGRRIGRLELLELSERFSAVFTATGLQEMRNLEIGKPSSRICQGIAFLDQARTGSLRLAGEEVLVIGGGNTAVDSARTALRLGAARVRIVYRRTRSEMPAIREEIEEALEEGVILDELLAPVRLREDEQGLTVSCVKMQLGEPDSSGRRRPVPQAGPNAEMQLPCSRVILALGQMGDLSILPEGAEVREGERLLGLSGAPVFLGGDLVTNEGTVAAAIHSGRRAALHIHRTLAGEDLLSAAPGPPVPAEAIRLNRFEKSPQQRGTVSPVAVRVGDFSEVRHGLRPIPGNGMAAAEASRCFSCGSCNFCEVCRANCPEGVLTREGNSYSFNYDYCKGCAICAFECPRGVIYMEQL